MGALETHAIALLLIRSRLHGDSNATQLMPHPPPTDSPARSLPPAKEL